jgi:superfamily II DNA or RNA helicase
MTATLRPYQESAVQAVTAAVHAGSRAPLLVAPTGAGKTVMAGAIARALGGTALAVVPRVELAEQMRRATGVQAVTVQALLASGDRPHADVVLLDEAHHLAADEWSAVARHYRATSVCVGLTATPERADGRAMGDIFDRLVVAATIGELTRAGHLVPCTVYAPAQRVAQLAEDPVLAYHQRGAGRRAILFARDVSHAATITEHLRRDGIAAEAVTADDPLRAEKIARFREGSLVAIVNVQILTEGFDDPSVEVIVLARGCSHAGTWLQIVGRALRPSPRTGKTAATVLDLLGSVHDHGLPTDTREYSLDGRAIRLRDEDAEDPIVLRQCADCGACTRAAAFRAGTCPSCGATLPARPDPRVRRAELAAVRATHGEGQRASALRDLMRVASERGYRHGWAMHRFRSRYGRWPTRDEQNLARGAG